MSKEFLIYIPYLVIGTLISIEDWKKNSVELSHLVLFFLACLAIHFFNHNFGFIIPIIFFIVSCIIFFIEGKKIIGLADYIFIIAISFVLKNESFPEFFTFCGISGIASHLIKRSKTTAFIPAIFLSANFCIVSLSIK